MAKAAKRATKRISNNKKRKVRELAARAGEALARGRQDIAEGICREMARIWPDAPDLLNIQALLAANRDDHVEAERLMVRAINLAPKRVDLYENLGTLYMNRHVPDAAEEVFRKALELAPRSFTCRLGLAAALCRQGGAKEALTILKDLHARQPDNVEVLLVLFEAHEQMDDYAAAMAVIERAAALAPDNARVHELRAAALMRQGDLAEAESALRVALRTAEGLGKARGWGQLALLKRFSANDEDMPEMERAYNETPPDSPARVYMAFATAKALEDAGRYDEAFARYAEGNDIRWKHSEYDLDAELAHLEAVMAAWTPDAFANVGGLEDERPVFIVGMPRCGSTLTEQILAAHPATASRGEWNAFEHSLFRLQEQWGETLTLETMLAWTPERWAEVGRAFLGRLDEGPQGARITDKTLINFRLVGEIHRALPKARFIHVKRHPLDNCLGMYRANFVGGQFDYIYSLRGVGYFYRMYARLMRHWASILPEGTMLEVRYEDLVTDPEREIRRMVEFLGLPWDEACLDFSRARTIVRTSSVAQVRDGMRKDYMQRWKRYEKHLEPLKRILADELADWPS